MIDKQARLAQILNILKDLYQAEEQGRYGIGLSMETREYNHVAKCAEKMTDIQNQREALAIEARNLQIELEDEAKESLL